MSEQRQQINAKYLDTAKAYIGDIKNNISACIEERTRLSKENEELRMKIAIMKVQNELYQKMLRETN